jgi:hypothetical protein
VATINITINTDNAAFDDPVTGGTHELTRVMATLVGHITADMTVGAQRSINDINGNTIGQWEITDD